MLRLWPSNQIDKEEYNLHHQLVLHTHEFRYPYSSLGYQDSQYYMNHQAGHSNLTMHKHMFHFQLYSLQLNNLNIKILLALYTYHKQYDIWDKSLKAILFPNEELNQHMFKLYLNLI